MTLTEKYIEDGRAEGIDKGILFGAIRQCQELLGEGLSPAEELNNLTEKELQALHDELETEVRQKLRN